MNEEVMEKLAKVGISVSLEQVMGGKVFPGWTDAEKEAAARWADLVLSAEKQKERKLKDGEKKVLVPQKPDFLRKY
jgi:hypothetical protein